MTGWISVKDRLPIVTEQSKNVLTWDGLFVQESFCTYDEKEKTVHFMGLNWIENSVVSHWMPLPKPPEDK